MLLSIINDSFISAPAVKKWVYQWKMEFNPDAKKQASDLIFSQKTNSPFNTPLFFNGIEEQWLTKHIWDLYLMKTCQTSVASHFDYCDVIYHLPPLDNLFKHNRTLNYLMERIENVQYEAALALQEHDRTLLERDQMKSWDGKPLI